MEKLFSSENLPALTGTAKQVAWAEKIRASALTSLQHGVDCAGANMSDYAPWFSSKLPSKEFRKNMGMPVREAYDLREAYEAKSHEYYLEASRAYSARKEVQNSLVDFYAFRDGSWRAFAETWAQPLSEYLCSLESASAWIDMRDLFNATPSQEI